VVVLTVGLGSELSEGGSQKWRSRASSLAITMSAALTFGLARHLRFSVPDVFSRGLLASALVPSFLAAPRLGTWTLPSLLDVLADLFPPILHAVPKKKVSHSRKAMRSANKGLKDKFST
jgi:hypothetical protein